jgi:Terminase RNaseH-like domain/Terminase large subunit, T4likevirus-type, N-terminal
MQVDLTGPQFDFVEAGDQFPAFVGGFGSGKTHAGIWRTLRFKLAYPAQNVAYYLPTYDLVTRMAFPRFAEVLAHIGIRHIINKNEAVIELEQRGSIIMRTMDNPARIVAYEVADSIADELDTLTVDKARDVWNKIIARNRQKKPDGSLNTVGVATTPEGFRFVYERWQRHPAPGYRLIKASTMSNAANLPDGYIDSLRSSYPPNLLAAYLDGEFVNLTSGSVYGEFDRKLNASTETIQVSEPLHIGMDFNVGQMAMVVFVLRDGEPHAVDEMTGMLDTPATIAAIKSRYEGHAIFVYPDASGNSRKSNNASESDIALLRAARFTVLVAPSNPAVKDRVLSMNQMIHSEGARRLKVNVDRCPSLVEGLEKQAYDKNGEPDKTSGLDHVNDACGYFIFYKFPVRGRAMQRVSIGGI